MGSRAGVYLDDAQDVAHKHGPQHSLVLQVEALDADRHCLEAG